MLGLHRFSLSVRLIRLRTALEVLLFIAACSIPVTVFAQGKGKGGGGSTPPPPPPIQFTMELITTASGSPNFGHNLHVALDINESGIVVGSAGFPNEPSTFYSHAYVWTPQSGMIDLNTLLHPDDQLLWTLGRATAINDLNIICGYGRHADSGRLRAFRLDLNTLEIEERMPAIGTDSTALDLNNFDESVGHFTFDPPPLQITPAYWAIDGEPSVLLMPPAESTGQAVSINDAGELAGYSPATGFNRRALIWLSSSSNPIDLGYLALGANNLSDSEAESINDFGHVAGRSSAGKYKSGSQWITYYHAFVWTPEQGMKSLGTLGGRNSNAFAINNRGDVVGESEVRGGYTLFFHNESMGMVDLRDAITNLPSSFESFYTTSGNINDAREIVGRCKLKNDSRAWGFVLRPVSQ